MLHWLSTAFSTYVLHSMHANGYQWWSGPGANFGELTLVTVVWRKLNCQSPWCFRLGHHQTADGHHLCRHHHPEHPGHRLTLPEIHARHFAALLKSSDR